MKRLNREERTTLLEKWMRKRAKLKDDANKGQTEDYRLHMRQCNHMIQILS